MYPPRPRQEPRLSGPTPSRPYEYQEPPPPPDYGATHRYEQMPFGVIIDQRPSTLEPFAKAAVGVGVGFVAFIGVCLLIGVTAIVGAIAIAIFVANVGPDEAAASLFWIVPAFWLTVVIGGIALVIRLFRGAKHLHRWSQTPSRRY